MRLFLRKFSEVCALLGARWADVSSSGRNLKPFELSLLTYCNMLKHITIEYIVLKVAYVFDWVFLNGCSIAVLAVHFFIIPVLSFILVRN